jgi:hypothetical protein
LGTFIIFVYGSVLGYACGYDSGHSFGYTVGHGHGFKQGVNKMRTIEGKLPYYFKII